jgi:hypothetical protein
MYLFLSFKNPVLLSAIYTYFKLLVTLLKYGRLRHSGFNFNSARTQVLSGLMGKITAEHYTQQYHTQVTGIRKLLWENPFLRSLLAQAAFIKNSYQIKGGHVHVPGLNLTYIRIPKAGSTSLSYSLLIRLIPDLKEKKPNPIQVNFLADTTAETHIKSGSQNSIWFTVVRDPFARMVSVYRDFFENASADFLYQDYLFGIFSRDLTFREFIQRLSLIPDALKDQHVKPQYMFLRYYKQNNISPRVFTLENTQALSEFLENYQLELPTLNKSRLVYDHRLYYDAETLELVFRIYKADVDQFGYFQNYLSLKDFLIKNPGELTALQPDVG